LKREEHFLFRDSAPPLEDFRVGRIETGGSFFFVPQRTVGVGPEALHPLFFPPFFTRILFSGSSKEKSFVSNYLTLYLSDHPQGYFSNPVLNFFSALVLLQIRFPLSYRWVRRLAGNPFNMNRLLS